MISSLYCTMTCESMFYDTNKMPYLRGILNSFSNSFFDCYTYEVVPFNDIRKNETQASHP